MFLSTILLALIVGALAGGGIPRLAELRLRWTILLVVALGLRIAAGLTRETGIGADIPVGWAYLAAYGLIFAWLWQNWRVPGLQVASVGIGANMAAVLVNAGQMPIWSAAYVAAGFTQADIANDPFHFILRAETVGSFVARGGLFGDVIPLPIPIIRDVVSIGDILLAFGIFWAIVYSMTRADAPARSALALGRTALRPATAAAGGAGAPFADAGRIPADVSAAGAEAAGLRRQSPYLRLVRNRNFSLLWIGQLVSLFGERIHTVALGFLVYEATGGSALEVGLTFAATAVPSVLLGPLAGTLVDRWNRRVTMAVCDVLRAALLLAVPLVIQVDVALVYVMAFLIATVTLLFRPAKTAVIPAVVEERDLVTANSMSSVADTAADLVGLPLAGLLIGGALMGSLEIAFVLGSSTYLVSAVLIWAMEVPRQELVDAPMRLRAIWAEMVEGWNYLRRQAELFSNTIISTVAQLAVGAEIVATIPYTREVLATSPSMPAETTYALLLTAIAVGSVLGGIGVGWLGDRVRKGPLTILGFVGMGSSLVVAGFVREPLVAIGVFFFTGLFNMLFIIPTITLFQQRTPQRLMGRVVSSRQALVFGAIAASMGLSGWLADLIGADRVLVVAGAICAVAGASGLLIPQMRSAR